MSGRPFAMTTAPAGRLIELDVTQPWRPPERARPHRAGRTWLSAALVLALVLGLTGGGQPGGSLEPMFVVQGSGVQAALAGTRSIFVLQQPNQGVAVLAAYRLADGAQVWSQPFPPSVRLVYADDRAVVLGTADAAGVVTGVDPDTGAVRWERDGYQAIQGSRSVVVAERFIQKGAEPSEGEVVGLNPATGATVWRFTTAASASTAYLADDGRLAEYERDGLLRVRDLTTGAVISTTRLPLAQPGDGFEVIGDLVLSVQEDYGWRVTAYTVNSGEFVWARTFADYGTLYPCGPVLCWVRPDAISGVDRATGLDRWSLVGFSAFRLLGDGSLVATSAAEIDRSARVLDTATGRTTARVEGWVLLAVAGPHALVGWRASPGGGALLALIDTGTGTARVFGRFEEWVTGRDCFVAQAHLACLGPTTLSVWHLPNAPRVGKMS